MINLIAELLFAGSQIFYLTRLVYQVKVSKEKGKSTTPILYWVLTIVAVLFIMAYGIFVESIIIPLSTIPTIFASLYNIYLELQREEQSDFNETQRQACRVAEAIIWNRNM
ncbi:hypothetical protein LCGC14_1819550, partial [marine sediment metagenome]